MTRTGGVYTPATTVEFEKKVAAAWNTQMGMLSMVGDLRVVIHVYTDRAAKQDVDNLAKSVLDGLQRGGAPLLLGTLWALLPCGLLYSALLVAALAGSVLGGAAVMAAFAIGTSVTMTAAPWLWMRLRGSPHIPGSGDWGVRLAGAALAASAAWARWMGLVNNTAPWCATV